MTAADLLRQAAALMRERAQVATPGSWSPDPTGTVCADADLRPDVNGGEYLPSDGPMEVAECYRNERSGERGANAAHIASWHPAVALAVADLLDSLIVFYETQNVEPQPLVLAVARTYLGVEAVSDAR